MSKFMVARSKRREGRNRLWAPNRLEAARRTYGPTEKVDVIHQVHLDVVDVIHQVHLDETMFKMMANENLEECGRDFTVMMETFRSGGRSIAVSLLVTKYRKPPNKKAARAGEARAQSRVNGTTRSFVACYSIVLAGASEGVHSPRPNKPDIRRMRREYRLLCEAQAPFERVFWQLEQRKGQLADQLANEGVAPFCRPRRGGQRLRKRFTRKGGSPCR